MASQFNLMVHCGGFHATEEQVKAVVTPQGDDTYSPIPHFEAFERIRDAFASEGYGITGAAHALAREGKRYFATMAIKPIVRGEAQNDYTRIVGLRNSHDKSFALGAVCGSGVFVCDNMAFTGEISFFRRHTRHLESEIDAKIDEMLATFRRMYRVQDERFAIYKDTKLDRNEVAGLILRGFDEGVIKKTRVTDIWQEYLRPRHEEFLRYGDSVWRLFNAFTEIKKGDEIFSLAGQTETLETILDERCGFSHEDFSISSN